MNWKTIRHLIGVDRKSSRLLRGRNLRKYNVKRNAFYNYLFYVIVIAAGLAVGFFAGYLYNLFSADAEVLNLINEYYPSFLVSLPTIVLIFIFIFTILQQIQRSGVRYNRQVPYWLPVTWEEHTIASILAELLGFPLLTIALISSAIIVFSLYVGQILLAVGSVLAMLGAAFMASATTEIFRILQVRFIGSVYKSTGRAAVWVRFIGSLIFFIVFYVIYFSITTGTGSLFFLQSVASAQNVIWFVPFVWLGLTLSSLTLSLWLQGIIFFVASALFISSLYLLATALNKRYGLYEPPAIKISSGTYAPKTGFIGKLGFSSVQSALIRKDLRAFTRRRELMFTFIMPIVFMVFPIMSSLNASPSQGPPGTGTLFWFVYTTLFPTTVMAVSLGSFMTGEEGQSMWMIYISPVSAKDFIRSKYAFIVFFTLVMLPITTAVGVIAFNPSIRATIVLFLESVFIAFAIGAISLSNGIKGADFNEVPRPRMMRPLWGIINFAMCTGVAFAILLPFIPYAISLFIGGSASPLIDPYVATAISGVIAAVSSVVFYKVAIGNAKELLMKAEL
jgi:hypothetical protein